MFWGKGDSSKLSAEERVVLDHLRRLVESGHIVALSPEQTDVALKAIKAYSNLTATTGFVAGLRNVSVWVGTLVMFWWFSKDAVLGFIRAAATTSGVGH